MAVRFQRKFWQIVLKYTHFGGLKIIDCVSHQPCQPPKLLGMNIFSPSQPVDKLHIPICREITRLNNTDIFGGQQSSQHIL